MSLPMVESRWVGAGGCVQNRFGVLGWHEVLGGS